MGMVEPWLQRCSQQTLDNLDPRLGRSLLFLQVRLQIKEEQEEGTCPPEVKIYYKIVVIKSCGIHWRIVFTGVS